MTDLALTEYSQEVLDQDAQRIFDQHLLSDQQRTDQMFALLLLFQWAAIVAVALTVSPRTWTGAASSLHPHVWLALWLGGLLSLFPAWLVRVSPGAQITRHVIAASQVLTSSLLIHVTGGRIESHFHIFGSLAFLAFYRDWRVLLTASLITTADHIARGFLWPLSIYGSSLVDPWRMVEHAAWVVFIDVFLFISTFRARESLYALSLREARQETLLHLAHHDSLTGLPNRLMFVDCLQTSFGDAKRARKKLALLCLDLDHFKNVNDRLGHPVGDRLLRLAADRLSSCLAPKEAIFRMGGDEFTIIVNDARSREDLHALASRLLSCLEEPFLIGAHRIVISASIGICLYPDTAPDLFELQYRSDAAMYRVKERGKNGVEVFTPESQPFPVPVHGIPA